MPDEQLPKKVLYGELQEGKRSQGGQLLHIQVYNNSKIQSIPGLTKRRRLVRRSFPIILPFELRREKTGFLHM